MFKPILWTHQKKLNLAKSLVSLLPTSSILPWDVEITRDAMIIPRLVPGIHLPPANSVTGSEVVTSQTFHVPAYFDMPPSESTSLKRVEIWANLTGVYELYSTSTDLQFRTILAPRVNYKIVAIYQNNPYAHEEVKTSDIYSFPSDGIVVGAHETLDTPSVLLLGTSVFDSDRFLYTGIATSIYDDFFAESSILPSAAIIGDDGRFFSAATLTSLEFPQGHPTDEVNESSVIASKPTVINNSYSFSTSGILLS